MCNMACNRAYVDHQPSCEVELKESSESEQGVIIPLSGFIYMATHLQCRLKELNWHPSVKSCTYSHYFILMLRSELIQVIGTIGRY